MEPKRFDFCILGDSQPEGLLLAAALARKSFKVLLLPSSALGELPTHEVWPMRIPEKFGERRLDELLFKAGFFRLEDSGLVAVPAQHQILLSRHRLSFDGKRSRFQKEMEREFPRYAERVLRLTGGKNSEPRKWNQVQAWGREDPALSAMMLLGGCEGRMATLESDRGKAEAMRRWVEESSQEEGRFFEVSPELQEPYCQFLLDHCRKWGVQVMDQKVDLQSKWRRFQIAPGIEAQRLVVNTFSAFRQLGRMKSFEECQRPISHWLYFDRIRLPLDAIPEPLGDRASFQAGGRLINSENAFVLHVHRDFLKDQAVLALGIWLPFQDSSGWGDRILRARDELRKLLPFIPEKSIPVLPSGLELAELKGECVRRGQVERLILEPRERRSAFRIPQFWRRKRTGPIRHSRVITSLPYLESVSGRRESLQTCFEALDQFEKKRPKKAT
jgi:hypothetical protein